MSKAIENSCYLRISSCVNCLFKIIFRCIRLFSFLLFSCNFIIFDGHILSIHVLSIFLAACSLLFHCLTGVYEQIILILIKTILCIFGGLVLFVFSVRNICSSHRLKNSLQYFLLETFMFRPMIHLKLTLVYGVN